MNNPLYSQHLEGDECDDERDANDTGAGQGDERDDEQDAIDWRGNMYEGDRSKDDRSKEGDRKNGDRNRDERFKNGDRNKEWPGTRKWAKTRDIRYIKEEDIRDTSNKDREKKQNQGRPTAASRRGTSMTPASRTARSSKTRQPGVITGVEDR